MEVLQQVRLYTVLHPATCCIVDFIAASLNITSQFCGTGARKSRLHPANSICFNAREQSNTKLHQQGWERDRLLLRVLFQG